MMRLRARNSPTLGGVGKTLGRVGNVCRAGARHRPPSLTADERRPCGTRWLGEDASRSLAAIGASPVAGLVEAGAGVGDPGYNTAPSHRTETGCEETTR